MIDVTRRHERRAADEAEREPAHARVADPPKRIGPPARRSRHEVSAGDEPPEKETRWII
jgi:hypothetical protein